jgi:hypothetical protein
VVGAAVVDDDVVGACVVLLDVVGTGVLELLLEIIGAVAFEVGARIKHSQVLVVFTSVWLLLSETEQEAAPSVEQVQLPSRSSMLHCPRE